ncbi:MAG: hypothetical protein V4689_19605 [Verrucomicrobiota bacterium]
MLLFFSIFGFIGIAVMAFLWGSGDGFGSPPLFFKVFGSFIALGFMVMGFGVPLSLLRKRKGVVELMEEMIPKPPPAQLACPNCGANLGNADVSPSGDAKCSYCKGWFNIHRRGV